MISTVTLSKEKYKWSKILFTFGWFQYFEFVIAKELLNRWYFTINVTYLVSRD